MAEVVSMPRQGQSVETCLITKWLKKPGDHVEKGELLFSYETDKAAFDEEAPASGTLLAVFFEEGDEVPVLTHVAAIGEEGEDISGLHPEQTSREEGTAAPEKASGKGEPVSPGGQRDAQEQREPGNQRNVQKQRHARDQSDTGEQRGGREQRDSGKQSGYREQAGRSSQPDGSSRPAGGTGRLRVSPRARRMAESAGISLHLVRGTGPNGRIIARDIEQWQAEHPSGSRISAPSDSSKTMQTSGGRQEEAVVPPTGEYEEVSMSRMRIIIADNMMRSLRESAQLTHHASADARGILTLRKAVKAGEEKSLPPDTNLNDMVCYAAVRALSATPQMNAHFMGDRIRIFHSVHLGMAVDTERGLMVPVLRHAERYSLGGLGQALKDLARSCKEGTIDPDLLRPEAGTFTVSNLGSYGIEMFTPVLNLPQCGILGVNTITHRPADLGDGSMGFVPRLGLSLTYDHRAIDGAPASAFLARVRDELENI